MFYVRAINRMTSHLTSFGPYETKEDAYAAISTGRRCGGNVRWRVRPLHAPAEGGDPHGAFAVGISGGSGQVIGPFATAAAARAWMRKNKLDCRYDPVFGYVVTLMLEIDEETAKWLRLRRPRQVIVQR